MGNFDRLNNEVLRDLKKCKENKTCIALTCRGYYFEPNPYTLDAWQKQGLYKKGIDGRAIFVCESPGGSNRLLKDDPTIARCWDETGNNIRFLEVRKKYGLENCFVTNVVKCGVRPNNNKHSPEEINNCSKFLKKEIEIIQPEVVVAVGREAERILRKYYIKFLESQGCGWHRISHYAFRDGIEALWDNWDRQFQELKNKISPVPKFIPINFSQNPRR